MNAELDIAMASRRRKRRRAWVQIGIGLAMIVASLSVTWFSFKAAVEAVIEHGSGTYAVWHGAAVVGFILFIRGLWRLLGIEEDALSLGRKPRKPPDALTVGFGFKTFVAWRYLMARDHRVSRAVLVVFLTGLYLSLLGFVLEHGIESVLNEYARDFMTPDIPPVLAKVAAQLTFPLRVGGAVLAGATLIVGVLRFVFSFFTSVPIVGVWIGTAALIIVLSVMSGFETDLRQKILGSNAHIQVTAESGDISNWREVKATIDKVPGVIASTPYAVSEVVIAANNNGMNVIIKGIDPQTVGDVTRLPQSIRGDQEAALKALAPLIDDGTDLTVPQPAPDAAPADVVDPPPPDMPSAGEPIDFSQPHDDVLDTPIDDGTGTDDAPAGSGAPLEALPPPDVPPGPAGDGAGAGTGDGAGDDDEPFGGDADYLVEVEPVLDPPPDDLLTTDMPPVDYSEEEADSDLPIQVVDVPFEPAMSRRTQSLPGILVGAELVKQTHLYVGEEVRVVSPLSDPANPDATGTPIPFNRDYRVAGTFFTGMYEYDLKYVYVTLDSLTDFLDRGDVVDGIEIRIANADETDVYLARLRAALGKNFRVQDWKELNRSLFSALEIEKIAMFLVLGIVILVASFSIIGNLIMVVVEKGREIALLKTLGASDRSVMQVFAIQGLVIGLIGTCLGVGTGLIACWLLEWQGFPLNPDVYYIDQLPVHVDPSSVLLTAFAGVAISMLATFYPAIVAARVRPAAGMRH